MNWIEKIELVKIILIVIVYGTGVFAEKRNFSGQISAKSPPSKLENFSKNSEMDDRPSCFKNMAKGELKDAGELLFHDLQDQKVFVAKLQDTYNFTLKKYQKEMTSLSNQADRRCLLGLLYVVADRIDKIAALELMAIWYNYANLSKEEEKIFEDDLTAINGRQGSPDFARKFIKELKSYLDPEP